MKDEPARGVEVQLDPASEQEWQRFARHLELASGFWLGLLFSPSARAIETMRRRTERLLRERSGAMLAFLPRTPEELRGVLPALLPAIFAPEKGPGEDIASACVWIEAVDVDPVPSDGEWASAWSELVRALNQNRDALRRRLQGGLVLAGPEELKAQVREEASDLWSVRTIVVEPGMESVPEVEAVPADELDAVGSRGPAEVDALIVTALFDELDAVLNLGPRGREGWAEERDRRGFLWHRTVVQNDRGAPLRIAVAWLGEMGGVAAATRTTELIDALNPGCLAMCGICAGDPAEVGLGDVIVADRVYTYDSGKQVVGPGGPVFFHDIETYNLAKSWKMSAAYLARELERDPSWQAAVAQDRPPSREAQARWLLHALYAHEHGGAPAPALLPERRVRCPGWKERVEEAAAAGLVVIEKGELRLLPAGLGLVQKEQLLHPDGLPADPPLRVHVGAIATGSAVQQDAGLFGELKRLARKTLGVEMEGAAIGYVASRLGRRSIVVKAVSDHADSKKDDSFRRFACRASAAFLMAFLRRHLDPSEEGRVPMEPVGHHRDRDGDDLEALRWMRGEGNDFLGRVKRIAELRAPEASITPRRAEAPFAGVLEISMREGRLVQLSLVGAIEQGLSRELFARFLEIEAPYRRANPLLRSVLVHGEPAAGEELLHEAYRRGVLLQTFAEYQGLIDFTRYLQWQTKKLEGDALYPPSLYVGQRAKMSLAGQPWTPVEDALSELRGLLGASYPRFVLVLGDFGTGKTFLLHELARRMAVEKDALTPVLVEMRSLEKQLRLDALLAQHFTRADMPRIEMPAFRDMLEQGRIALLFDGFDELALRVSYDRAVEHFDTVIEAAGGNAKIVVTSRSQYFLTDHDVRKALAERAEKAQGYRLVKLEAFDQGQIKAWLGKKLGSEEAADARFELLEEVKDLLGLSHNPRMLSFILELDPTDLEKARDKNKEITAGAVYGLLVHRWLKNEYDRVNPLGAPPGLKLKQLWAGVTKIALFLWPRTERWVRLKDLPASLTDPIQVDGKVEQGVIEHLFGSGSLLVRDEEGRFSFIHQSVMEWFVARKAAREVKGGGDAPVLGLGKMSELMAGFFIDLVGSDGALAWAEGELGREGGNRLKKNAMLVLRVLRERIPAGKVELAEGVDLVGQDLRGQDLSGADLRGADLSGVDLTNATLTGANLEGANLEGATLVRANLDLANLGNANLRGVRLTHAHLLGADLRGATLEEAYLQNAAMVGARVDALASWLGALEFAGGAPPVPRGIEMMTATASIGDAALAWSRQSDLLAIGCNNGSIVIWDVATGRALRTLWGHRGKITSVTFDAVSDRLASGSEDRTVRMWEIRTGRSLIALEGHTNKVTSVAFAPGGDRLASGSVDHTVRLWDTHTGRSLLTLAGHADNVMSVAFDATGKRLASGSHDTTVRLWDARSGHPLFTLEGHANYVTSVAFDAAGERLASGSHDTTVRLWDARSGHPLFTLEGHTSWVTSVAFDATGERLASASYDSTVRMWDVRSGRSLLTVEDDSALASVAFDAAGERLASASYRGTVRLWNVRSRRPLFTLNGHMSRVSSLTFDATGERLASGSYDDTVRLWDVRSGRPHLTLKGYTTGVSSLAFDASGERLASGSYDNTVRMWDAHSGRPLLALNGHATRVSSLAFDAAGERLASGSHDNTVRLWDAHSGHPLLVLRGHKYSVNSVAFDAAGERLASGSNDNTVRLWDARSGHPLLTFKGHTDSVSSVAFDPSGKHIASGSHDKTVRMWDAHTGRSLLAFQGHTDSVSSVAFDPSGKHIASGSNDTTVGIGDAQTGRLLRVLEGHTAPVTSIAFHPTTPHLASGSQDGTIRLWNTTTGACLAVLLSTPEGWAAYTPDGRYKFGGDLAGSFWQVIGLCRFEPGELDPYLPAPMRMKDDEPLW